MLTKIKNINMNLKALTHLSGEYGFIKSGQVFYANLEIAKQLIKQGYAKEHVGIENKVIAPIVPAMPIVPVMPAAKNDKIDESKKRGRPRSKN